MTEISQTIQFLKLNILFYMEEDYYIAHCIEFDILHSQKKYKDLLKNIKNMCFGQLQYAIKNDPDQKNLFRSPEPTIIKKLAKSKYEGTYLCEEVDNYRISLEIRSYDVEECKS